jgi:glucose-6-phosphate isomerase
MSAPPQPASFAATAAFRRLSELARRPHDLTAPGGFSPARIAQMRAGACELDVLYAAQRVSPDIMAALADLAREMGAVERFREMVQGAVINRIEGHPSENRRVLHCAARHLFDELPDRPEARLPADAVAEARKEAARLARFLEGVDRGTVGNARGEPFTEMINVGIGGSDLGPRALYVALQPWRKDGRRVHFVSNVDPDDPAHVLREAHLERTLVNVVSKSGSTLETRTDETLLRHAYVRAGLDPSVHFVCVTSPGSPLDASAQYREKFHTFDYVGGRYSATSAVGGVSLGFGLGWPAFEEFLRGAREMDLASQDLNLETNLPLLLALLGVWNRNFLGLETLAVIPYSQALSRFVAHLQQLDMESNGKSVTRAGQPVQSGTGPVVWGEPGTNSQHAFFQLLHQGPGVVPCEFLGFRESQYGEDLEVDGTTSQHKLLANLLAQVIALATGKPDANPNRRFPGNRPSTVILGQRLTPRVLGRLLALYENKVAYQGFLWGINSFDQEGVELGKVVAKRVLPLLTSGAAPAPSGAPESIETALLRAARILPR